MVAVQFRCSGTALHALSRPVHKREFSSAAGRACAAAIASSTPATARSCAPATTCPYTFKVVDAKGVPEQGGYRPNVVTGNERLGCAKVPTGVQRNSLGLDASRAR